MCVMPRVWRLIQGGYAIVKERETFASRLGFVLISAGCAIGLGNVWRFPPPEVKEEGVTVVVV